jgi:hypothetical protein
MDIQDRLHGRGSAGGAEMTGGEIAAAIAAGVGIFLALMSFYWALCRISAMSEKRAERIRENETN